ncbi:MAG: type II 3-dehydroquinate dehydratase [Leptospirillia bacterium]
MGTSGASSHDLLVLHGPNLNLLGEREPDTYGRVTLKEIDARLAEAAKAEGYAVRSFQSNHEGELVDLIQKHGREVSGILINPAAFTHTSVALRDALLSISVPVVEVHLSNIHRREDFRKKSLVADIAVGQVAGFGADSYRLGLDALISHLRQAG